MWIRFAPWTCAAVWVAAIRSALNLLPDELAYRPGVDPTIVSVGPPPSIIAMFTGALGRLEVSPGARMAIVSKSWLTQTPTISLDSPNSGL